MKDPTTSAFFLLAQGGHSLFFSFCSHSASFFLAPLRGENGPIEMGQNMILLTGIIWSIYHYTQETHLHRPSYWLLRQAFSRFFSEGKSAGAAFFF